MRRLKALCCVTYFILLNIASASGQNMPPPPVTYLEIFNATYSTHQVSSLCAGTSADLSWTYDKYGTSLVSLKFNGEEIGKSNIIRINNILKNLSSDVFARVECGNEGAIVTFIADGAAPTGRGPVLQINVFRDRSLIVTKDTISKP